MNILSNRVVTLHCVCVCRTDDVYEEISLVNRKEGDEFQRKVYPDRV